MPDPISTVSTSEIVVNPEFGNIREDRLTKRNIVPLYESVQNANRGTWKIRVNRKVQYIPVTRILGHIFRVGKTGNGTVFQDTLRFSEGTENYGANEGKFFHPREGVRM